MATGVAGTVSLEPSDWSLPLTVLAAHGLHAGSSRGGGPPPNNGRTEVGAAQARVGGMARSLAWSSEHVGCTLLRGAGEEALVPLHWVRHLIPVSTLPLLPTF